MVLWQLVLWWLTVLVLLLVTVALVAMLLVSLRDACRNVVWRVARPSREQETVSPCGVWSSSCRAAVWILMGKRSSRVAVPHKVGTGHLAREELALRRRRSRSRQFRAGRRRRSRSNL